MIHTVLNTHLGVHLCCHLGHRGGCMVLCATRKVCSWSSWAQDVLESVYFSMWVLQLSSPALSNTRFWLDALTPTLPSSTCVIIGNDEKINSACWPGRVVADRGRESGGRRNQRVLAGCRVSWPGRGAVPTARDAEEAPGSPLPGLNVGKLLLTGHMPCGD